MGVVPALPYLYLFINTNNSSLFTKTDLWYVTYENNGTTCFCYRTN